MSSKIRSSADDKCGIGGSELRWFAVQTLPRRETGATQQLRFQGYDVFLPLHWKTVRHARRFRNVKAAFFPRYIFVRLNRARDRWRPINGTFGVASLVMAGGSPMPVPRGIVEELGAMTGPDGVMSFEAFEPGQRVRVLTGPFADHIGELVHARDTQRVQILLDIMGVQRIVQIRKQAIAPVA